jgi:ribonuclease T1
LSSRISDTSDVGVLKFSGQLRRLSVGNRVFKLVLACFLSVAVCLPSVGFAKTPTESFASDEVLLAATTPQVRETYRLIRQGGPFPFEKDGVVFGNREGLLPAKSRGYYREYTVKAPNSDSRGIQRIVCGGASKEPDACYYTADHYASFRKIVP